MFPFEAALLVPITIFAIPIVAILTSHQQKMAKMIYGGRDRGLLENEVQSLREEVAHLRQVLNRQAQILETTQRKELAGGPDPELPTGRLSL